MVSSRNTWESISSVQPFDQLSDRATEQSHNHTTKQSISRLICVAVFFFLLDCPHSSRRHPQWQQQTIAHARARTRQEGGIPHTKNWSKHIHDNLPRDSPTDRLFIFRSVVSNNKENDTKHWFVTLSYQVVALLWRTDTVLALWYSKTWLKQAHTQHGHSLDRTQPKSGGPEKGP